MSYKKNKIKQKQLIKTHQPSLFPCDSFKYTDTDNLFFSTVKQNLRECNKDPANSCDNIRKSETTSSLQNNTQPADNPV
jgi:hypothetical protein